MFCNHGCRFVVRSGRTGQERANLFRPSPEMYAQHLQRVMQQLPPHSGSPPLLDLSKPEAQVPGAGKKWEDRFTGGMGVKPYDDPGIHALDEATSITTGTTDYAGAPPLLPAKSNSIVAIAKPLRASTHLAYNRRIVYSSFEVQLLEVLKGDRREIRQGAQIVAAQFGGSVRFPSGHEETCLEAQEGFLEPGKTYLVFLWKPIKSSETYAVDEAYLLEGAVVWPVSLRFGGYRYSGTSVER